MNSHSVYLPPSPLDKPKARSEELAESSKRIRAILDYNRQVSVGAGKGALK